MYKICTKCKLEKELHEYVTNNKTKDKKQPYCRACTNETQRQRRKNGDNTTYRFRYGKTVEELNSIRELQNNRCKICDVEFTNSFNTVVDHCHTTNTFRGFLCRKCNVGIGMFGDNPELLRRALLYLST